MQRSDTHTNTKRNLLTYSGRISLSLSPSLRPHLFPLDYFVSKSSPSPFVICVRALRHRHRNALEKVSEPKAAPTKKEEGEVEKNETHALCIQN